jgi:hypothetical protein
MLLSIHERLDFTQAAVKDYQKKRSAGKSPQAAMAEVRQEQQAATA